MIVKHHGVSAGEESALTLSLLQGEALLRDLLAIHVVAHLNEALCLNYRKMCPASTMLSEQCDRVLLAGQVVPWNLILAPQTFPSLLRSGS